MGRQRLEAFSDGVFAVIITIMVLDLKVPVGSGLTDLLGLLPSIYGYALSFIFVGIYWTNHHHLMHTVGKTNGGMLWVNLFLLFWISLFPFCVSWLDTSHFAGVPTAVYAVILFMAAISYTILQNTIIATHGRDSLLAKALGNDFKGKISIGFYVAALAAAFYMPMISQVLFVTVAIIWLVPDRRIERVVTQE